MNTALTGLIWAIAIAIGLPIAIVAAGIAILLVISFVSAVINACTGGLK